MRVTLGVEGNSVRSAVKGHVQGSRSGCNSINCATAGACRKLNDVGEVGSVNSDSLVLRSNWTALKLISHIVNLLCDSRHVSLDPR